LGTQVASKRGGLLEREGLLERGGLLEREVAPNVLGLLCRYELATSSILFSRACFLSAARDEHTHEFPCTSVAAQLWLLSLRAASTRE